MKFQEIKRLLEAEVIVAGADELEVSTACGADLMSDVLTFTHDNAALLTGLTNPQVVRTAEMINLVMIIFVRGKRPPEATIELATEKNIPLIMTDKTLYHSCGLLYKAGLKPDKLSKL